MGKLKKLQEQYVKGEITAAQYREEIKKLLDDGNIDQEQYDEAVDYDPEYERPQYSQSEVDEMIQRRAVRMLRKALKDGGVDISADNKNLVSTVVEQLKAAKNGKNDDPNNEQDAEALTTAKTRIVTLESKIKDLSIENAVLREAGTYNPVNPTQVVRAIRSDYMDDIDYDDETGDVDKKSVGRVLKRVSVAEPNLFKTKDENPDQDRQGLKSKGPGGGTGGADDKTDEKVKSALSLMGIAKKEN